MIFICYGLPKSASSFVYQMTYHAAESLQSLGRGQIYWLLQFFPDFPPTPFMEMALKDGLKLKEPWDDAKRDVILDAIVEPLLERVGTRSDVLMVLKTHLPCSPVLAKAIERGSVLASATFRHPAEMMLSRRDMARKKNEIIAADELKSAYKTCINDFFTWANLASVRKYYYDDIVINPSSVVADIYEHVGSPAGFDSVLEEYVNNKTEKIWEFNKGIIDRSRHEMSPEEICGIEESYPDFMNYIRRHKQGWPVKTGQRHK
jgi:hypothetical protein